MNIIAWQRLDCIHKDVCFHNGIRCGEFVCKDIKPIGSIAERTCRNDLSSNPYARVFFKCSNCGFPSSESIADQWLLKDVRYCPNCGAKVIGE